MIRGEPPVLRNSPKNRRSELEKRREENLKAAREAVSAAMANILISDVDGNDFSSTVTNRGLFTPVHSQGRIREPIAPRLFGINLDKSLKGLHKFIDNKKILLVGGGASVQDLTSSPKFTPAVLLNVDPYTPDVARERKSYYRRLPLDPTSENFLNELRAAGHGKFNEIWASYSLPPHCKGAEEIEQLFGNLYDALEPNGNIRDYPLAFFVQGLEGLDYQPPEKRQERLAPLRTGLSAALNTLANKDDIAMSILHTNPPDMSIKNPATLLIHKLGTTVRKRLTERGAQEPYLIVEVGSGDSPFLVDAPEDYLTQFRNDPNARLIALDSDEGELDLGRERMRKKKDIRTMEAADRIEFRKAYGEQLPFENNAISELVLKNVMGDEEIFPGRKARMIDEAARTLKPGGILKIIEQYTPKEARKVDVEHYISTAVPVVFEKVEGTETAGMFDEREMDRRMLTPTQRVKPDAFILRFRKKP